MNAVFIPHEKLELLAAAGRVDLSGDQLSIAPEGCRYRATEAVRVIREVASGSDALGLCGTVRTRAYLCDEVGGELLGDSMLIDEAAYEVVPGVLCEPAGPLPAAIPHAGAELKLLASFEAT